MAKHELKRVLIQQSEFSEDYKVVLQKRVKKQWKSGSDELVERNGELSEYYHELVAPLDIAEETARHWAKKHDCKIRKKGE